MSSSSHSPSPGSQPWATASLLPVPVGLPILDSRYFAQMESCDTWAFASGFFHLASRFRGPSTSRQLSVLRCLYGRLIFHCPDIPRRVRPFIC